MAFYDQQPAFDIGGEARYSLFMLVLMPLHRIRLGIVLAIVALHGA
jgi:hypothetical protein